MLGPPPGIAHVSYRGGSLSLPARNAYDRQVLAAELFRDSDQHDTVQVLLDDDRWLVHRLGRPQRIHCRACGAPTDRACRSDSGAAAPLCIGCAVGIPWPSTGPTNTSLLPPGQS